MDDVSSSRLGGVGDVAQGLHCRVVGRSPIRIDGIYIHDSPLWCRIEAMETALTFLDARAKAVIANALEVALAKKKTERDELQSTVQILSSLLSGPPMQTEN